MNNNNKILSLKIIKTTFDVILIVMSLFVLMFIVSSVFMLNINKDTVLGKANIYSNQKPIILTNNVPSALKGVTLQLHPDYLQTNYSLKFTEQHSKALLYRIFFDISLNLSMLFIIFILFQIRNIISSIIKSERAKEKTFQERIFSQKNLKRMRYISYGFFAMPIIEVVSLWIDKLFLKKYIILKGYSVNSTITYSDVSWDYLLIGLLFFVLIEIIRKGIDIQDENDLTI